MPASTVATIEAGDKFGELGHRRNTIEPGGLEAVEGLGGGGAQYYGI
jgi:hypothetical protein